jgi:hypothetical protein
MLTLTVPKADIALIIVYIVALPEGVSVIAAFLQQD